LTNPQSSGIINSEELMRDENKTLRVSMDEAKFNKSKAAFERSGGEMASSAELDEYLNMRGAGAITLNEDLIIFKHGSPPTASEFFEELIHTAQFKQGRVSTEMTTKLEIEAKEKLIKYQKQYGIPDHENEQTKNQLEKLNQLLSNER
jgi:hypothetical protein